jgi:AcrR family transcriptional regulator
LLAATLRAAFEEAETVTRVVAIAGVGRSTFHEFFDDFPHALRVARAHALKSMREAFASASHDEQGLEALVAAWIDGVREEPELALVTLRVSGDRSLSELGSVFAATLGSSALAEVRASEPMQLRFALAAAAAEGCARELARRVLTQAGVTESDAEQVKRLLVATVRGILAVPPRDKI